MSSAPQLDRRSPGTRPSSPTAAAILGGIAVVTTAAGLRPLLVGVQWWLDVLAIVSLVVGVGLLLRALRTPAGLVALLQVAAGAGWLVATTVRSTLWGGLLPTPDTFWALRAQLRAALVVVNTAAPPVLTGPGMLLLVTGSLGLVALAIDHLVLTWRVPALTAVPLLAVHVVTMVSAPAGVSALDFAVAAVALLVLLLVAQGRSPTTASPRAPALGARIGLLGVGLAVLLPAVLPGLGSSFVYHIGYHSPTADGDGTGTGGSGGSTLNVRDPLVQLKRNLSQPDDVPVLTYQTDDASMPYLRLSTLDAFDGQRWRAGARNLVPLGSSDPLPSPVGATADGGKPVVMVARIAEGLRSRFLPVPYPATAVTVRGDWNVDTRGLDVLSTRALAVGGLDYRVRSLTLTPDPSRLRAADPKAVPDDIRVQDLALPDNLPRQVVATARKVSTSGTNDFDRAVLLQSWFRTDFAYDVSYHEGTSNGALLRFLADRRGYCEQFAGTMAVMARGLGIPARVVTGFLPGTDDGSTGTMKVTAHDAHAWPELWFAGSGWVRFEPTPPIRTGNAPAYTEPAGPGGPGVAQPGLVQPPAGAGRPLAAQRPPSLDQAGGASGSATSSTATSATAAALAGLVVVVILIVPHLSVTLWRRRRRARARSAGGQPRQVQQAWDEVRWAAVEAGIGWDNSASPRAAGRRVLSAVARAREDGRAPDAVAAATKRLVDLAERVGYAAPRSDAVDLSGLDTDVGIVTRAVRRSSPRRNRVAAFLLPEPARRWRTSGS